MLLSELIQAFDPRSSRSSLPEIDITGVREDSRRVQRGNLFIARPGTKTEGTRFIADAAARGAAAIVTSAPVADCLLPQILVNDPNAAASRLANIFHGYPATQVKVLAITGTNGKTTTTYLARHLLGKVGRRCGLVGTVQVDDGRTTCESSLTTPSATDLIELLAKMRDNGCWTCALEASSHALHQGRLAEVQIAGAAFTNLTGDHLDYHGTMENYAAAKAKLFEKLDDLAVGVVNQEDEASARMARDCRGRIIRFGFKRKADYWAKDVLVSSQGSQFVLVTPDGEAPVKMSLIGKHNVENALTAAALVGEVFGLSVHQIATGLSDAQGAPGRLQAVRYGQPFAVLVDYAHTDDALENVLSALKPLTRGRLRILFGCGGDRDRTKRPRMARTAERLADVIYVTSDNPRTEDPQAIVDEILTGFSRKGDKTVIVEVDRRKAIEKVLTDARSGDVVLLAGKGHENYQIVGTEKRHFDDVEEAMRVLEAAGSRQ